MIAIGANHLIADLGHRGLAPGAALVISDQDGLMRDGLGVLPVAVGLSWTVPVGDKLGLVIAFAGVTLLACDVLGPPISGADHGKEPPIF